MSDKRNDYHRMMAARYQHHSAWDHRLGLHAFLRGDAEAAVWYQQSAEANAAKARRYLDKALEAA